jgi:hypothetical protein
MRSGDHSWKQHGQIVCETPISKITRAKWTGGVTHAVERLLCKHEALSSSLSPAKKKKKLIKTNLKEERV